MRYRLIAPEWLRASIPEPYVLEGDFSQDFIYQKNAEGWNVYYFPNCPNKLYADGFFINGRHIDTFQYVFVDCDIKDGVYKSKEEFLEVIKEWHLQPTHIVDSGNGIHVYWRIDNLTREDYVIIQLQLIQQFNTDDSVWTVLQLMRFPNTLNTKDPNNIKECTYLEDNDISWNADTFMMHLPAVTDDNLAKAQIHLDKLDGKYVEQIVQVNRDELPYKFTVLLDKEPKIKELFENPIEACGDRSTADMKLCNILFNKDYSKNEAYQVMLNTVKALSRAGDRDSYAWNIVDKVYTDRPQNLVTSVAEKNKNQNIINLGEPVCGPEYFDDVLANRWRKKQVLGVIGGSGAGKTTASLQMIHSMAKRNKDDIFIFFTLEMTEGEIIDRWNKLTGGDQELSKRFYVVSNEDEQGNARHIGLQEMYWFAKDIHKYTGKNIGAIVIDHVGIISNMIDTTKHPHFDAASAKDAGKGDIKKVNLEFICSKFKELSKTLNCFTIIQSQTTKEKAGEGDIPLGLSAAYGVSHFEWFADYIISLWQPLKRVHNKTKLRILAWWYCKIREKHQDDLVAEFTPYVLYYDMPTGSFRPITEEEDVEFRTLLSQANALRARASKKQERDYELSPVSQAEIVKRLERLK